MADKGKGKKKHFVLGKDFRSDGHVRLTKGDDWVVEGGTEESHEETTDIVNNFSKKLRREPENINQETAQEIFRDVIEEHKRRN